MVAAVKLTKLAPVKLDDANAERSRDSVATAIGELQSLPATGLRVIKGVQLANGVDKFISHGLGRAPESVMVSPIRIPGILLTTPDPTAAGVIVETRGAQLNGGPIDGTRFVVLTAFGFNTTVTVDVWVL